MTEKQLGKVWVREFYEKDFIMSFEDAAECALMQAKKMVEYRVPPLQYWENVVKEIEINKTLCI